MASFPNSLKNFTAVQNGIDLYDAIHINDLQAEVMAVETDLLNFFGDAPRSIKKLVIGGSTAKTQNIGVNLSRYVNTDNSPHGFVDGSIFEPFTNRAYAAFDAFFEAIGTNAINHLVCFQARGEHKGSGVVGNYYMFGSFPTTNLGVTPGKIVNLYHYFANGVPATISGGVDNHYGIYLANIDSGAVSNYAIFTNAGMASFGGGVEVRNGGISTLSGGLSLVTTSSALTATRNVSLATGAITLGNFIAKTSADMTDGFGPAFSLTAQDDTSGAITLAQLVAVRNGADNTGKLLFKVTSAGTVYDTLSIARNAIGFNGTAPVTKPTVSGAKGSNAALASLLTALSSMGLITDSTTA